jgi:cholesterol transport system auxiliary component
MNEQRFRTPARAAVALLLASSLGACALLRGGGGEQATIFAPEPRVVLDPAAPTVDWQLSLSPPTAARVFDSFRIAVRPEPGELQVYSGVGWAKRPTDMLQDSVLRALEDSGKIGGASRQGSGAAGDYRLLTDLRRFESDYAGNAVPAATIEVNAKLLHAVDRQIVASRTFRQAVPAAGTDPRQVSAAFSQALATVAGDIASWVLVTGDAHDGMDHPLDTP